MASNAPFTPVRGNHGGSSAGLTALLALAAVGGGLYFVTHLPERKLAPVKEDNLAQVAALARVEKEAELIQRAIREHQVILGMTYRDVEMAKGRPHAKQRGDTLPEIHRAKGGIEYWIYDLGGGEVSDVLFGANGRVIQISDAAGKSVSGQPIRQ